MADSAAVPGKGMTLGFCTTSNGSFTTVAELVSCGFPKISVATFEATHATSTLGATETVSTGWKHTENIPFEANYIKTSTTTLVAQLDVKQFWKVTVADSTTASSFLTEGILTEVGGAQMSLKDGIKLPGVISPTGPLTFTAGS